jgi:putative membrane protein
LSGGREASERIVGYYSYLFTFPSRSSMVLIVLALSTISGVLSYYVGWGGRGDFKVLLYGPLGLALPLLLTDLVVVPLFEGDAFLNPRRFTILTYASTIVYAVLIFLSSVLVALTGRTDLIFKGMMMAVAVNAALRYLAVRVFAEKSGPIILVASFMQPTLCFVAAALLLPLLGNNVLASGLLAVIVVVGGVHLLLATMRRWEGVRPGLDLIPLFRAFVVAWAEDLNGPLEEQITGVGEETDLAVDSIVFEDDAGGFSASLIVPYIHPGPFRRIGSSGLPTALVDRIGEELGCEALVTHGVSTHSRDLTRSGDNERVAEKVVSNLLVNEVSDLATPMVWGVSGGARASCQLFGETALVTLSLSPMNYDDLPEELYERIVGEARGMGLDACVVDSHHSIDLDRDFDEYDPEKIFKAAALALNKARGMPKSSFSVGAHRVVPAEWGLDEGMGPNGITALVVRLKSGQTSAYIVVDGNNMVTGLRERIIGAVKNRGMDGVEVLTSDTHLVNGIGATTSGYFPIGARTEGERVIGYAVEAVEKASSRLKEGRARQSHTVIRGLTVLGSGGLDTLSQVLESGFGLLRRAGLTIMPTALILAALVLLFS